MKIFVHQLNGISATRKNKQKTKPKINQQTSIIINTEANDINTTPTKKSQSCRKFIKNFLYVCIMLLLDYPQPNCIWHSVLVYYTLFIFLFSHTSASNQVNEAIVCMMQ